MVCIECLIHVNIRHSLFPSVCLHFIITLTLREYNIRSSFDFLFHKIPLNPEAPSHKMVKHTQTIRRLLPMNYLSVFVHVVALELKRLTWSFSSNSLPMREMYFIANVAACWINNIIIVIKASIADVKICLVVFVFDGNFLLYSCIGSYLIVSATRRRKDIKMLLCLSVPMPKSLI